MANRIEDDSMALEVDGKALVERNRFIQLTGGTTSVNRELETKTHALARTKGYHQPAVMRGWHSGLRGLRDRRVPPAVPDRVFVSHSHCGQRWPSRARSEC